MMVETKKIELPLQKLLNQEPTEVICHFIELDAEKIRWVGEFYADEHQKNDDGDIDKSLPMVNVFNFFDINIWKNRISMCQMVFAQNVELWKVEVQATGTNEDINVYFKSRHKAEMLKEELLQWMLS